MNRIYYLLLILLNAINIWAQPNWTWLMERDFNRIEINLTIKDSNGNKLIFDKKENDTTLTSRNGYKLESFLIKYDLGGGNGLFKTVNNYKSSHVEKMTYVYERIYQNHPNDYTDLIKKILTPKSSKTIPNCPQSYMFLDSLWVLVTSSDIMFSIESFEKFDEQYSRYLFDSICLPTDTLCYRYCVSDNIVYKRKNYWFSEKTETLYFVPIGDLRIVLTMNDKKMCVDFELYNYRKLGLIRQPYSHNIEGFPHMKIFMEIQFQEGEFVVTDESYPNLIRKK